MNFAFADIDPSAFSLVQQNISQTGITGKGNAGSPNFSDHLKREVETLDWQGSSNSPLRTISQSGITDHREKLETLQKTLSRKNPSGTKVVSQLRDLFLSLSNGDLESLSIDAQGLENLKKILVKAGFDADDVDEILSGLLEGADGGKVQIDDLMTKLSELDSETDEDEEKDETLVGSSFLPFIQSILETLGLTAEQVDSIVSQADKGERGIDLDQILESLKSLEKEANEAGFAYQTQEGDDSFVRLLEQMGLEKNGSSGSSSLLSLKDFISSLETLKQKISVDSKENVPSSASQAETSKDKGLEWINSLFKHLEAQVESKGEMFSEAQIRDQFKTDLMSVKNNKTNNPLPAGQVSQEAEPDFKEFESLLKNSLSDSGEKKSGLENPSFKKVLSDSAGEGEKNSSLTSGAGAEAKVQDSKLSLTRTQANFKSLPNYVTQQVGKSIVKAINQGENSLKIQLKPPELGRLVMTVDHTGNSMKVSILTENQAAKDILTSNVAELKTILTNSGISLDQFDVDMSSNFKQSMADARNPSQDGGKKNQGKEKIGFDGSAGETVLPEQESLQEGTLHYVA